MKEYKNYIFDLYGTLVDICTNEHKPSLWKLMAEFYNVFGCRWSGKTLSDAFWKMDAEEREVARNKMGVDNPEIKLERVFGRLLFEVQGWDYEHNCSDTDNIAATRVKYTVSSYKCSMRIAGISVNDLRERYSTDKEEVLNIVTSSDWCVAVSNFFRVHSRKFIRPYANTISTLTKLKEQGKGIYLLSNAQRIFTMPEIEMTGLHLLFDKMYISSDCEIMKPQKEFMEKLLAEEKLDISETVMVGNELRSDVMVALRCGVDSIYLNTSSYTKNEINKEWKTLMKKENISGDYAPHIVMSGDIAEILNFD